MATYRDLCNVREADVEQSVEASSESKTQTFPVVLHYVLSELRRDGQSHIMAWRRHGRAFAFYEEKAMEEKVLPW